ncbi:hypothetical protein [Photorhabdus viridis]|uniref:hypothetical protein n=1 Tax=Photorhabdus viridis TaxID=3163327 RepID=UPI0033079EBA
MIEKMNDIVELQKLLDSSVNTLIGNVHNFLGKNMMNVTQTPPDHFNSHKLPHHIDDMHVWVDANLLIPKIGLYSTTIQPILLTSYSVNNDCDNDRHIWLFQDSRSSDGVIKYSITKINEKFDISKCSDVPGNSTGGGKKTLMCTLDPTSKDKIRLRMY